MPARFDSELKKLKQKLLHMGAIAEQMIQSINSVLTDNNQDLLPKIYEDEKILDRMQGEIDEETVKLITVYTPVAGDLRLLLMITRMNADIERIGDKVVDIGHNVEKYLQSRKTKHMIDFTHVVHVAAQMLHDALDSFVNKSVHQAIKVIATDEEVDQITDQSFRVLFTHMLSSPSDMGNILGLMLTAQAFERIADHAVNIAEEVVYIVQGEDVRHMKTQEIKELDK
ncbi:MAG: phosphate signaling complex protein PhoU [Phycisphaerae bacterium]|nr:phosphate signaling complex protein PhoU [Phycisphaerae bacterium]